MRKIVKIVLIILLIVFVGIQFIRPQRNASEEIAANMITAKFSIPANVQQTLKVSCYDCHTNHTYYPWYWQLQPVAWFLNNHINNGKRHLNFSEFANYSISTQYKKLDEIGKEVKSDGMPLTSYTIIHRDAVLNTDQKLAIENWVANSKKNMEAQYAPDSLKKK